MFFDRKSKNYLFFYLFTLIFYLGSRHWRIKRKEKSEKRREKRTKRKAAKATFFLELVMRFERTTC